MEWIERFNQAVQYLEDHLEEQPDYSRAAQLACCSVYHFQRVFACLAGVPLSEYIRRRRMTLAAAELQKGGQKILDLALQYGYASPTAFNRAFQSVHGLPPSAAKKPGATLKSYPPIRFQITVQGVEEMEYRVEQKPAFRIVGLAQPLEQELEKNFALVPQLWARAAAEGAIPRLLALIEAEGAGGVPGAPGGIIGASVAGGQEQWSYLIAAATEQPAPEGMEERKIPAMTWAIFPGKGPMPQAVQQLERRIVAEWLPGSGYEYADGPDLELYLDPNPAEARFEIWLPVVKRPG